MHSPNHCCHGDETMCPPCPVELYVTAFPIRLHIAAVCLINVTTLRLLCTTNTTFSTCTGFNGIFQRINYEKTIKDTTLLRSRSIYVNHFRKLQQTLNEIGCKKKQVF